MTWIIPRIVTTRIPGEALLSLRCRGGQHAREAISPAVLDAQRDCVGEEAFEDFGRVLWRIHSVEPLALGDRQILLEPRDVVEDATAFVGRRVDPEECRDYDRQGQQHRRE